MRDNEPIEPRNQFVIGYYSPRPSLSQRTSRLAVLSMLLSVLSCPCLTGWVVNEVRSRLRVPLPTTIELAFVAPLAVVLIAVAALRQIRASNGRLKGRDYAYFALTFCGLWLLTATCVWAAFRDFQLGPRD
jgi:ABC-type sulfate transport system permease component